MKRILSTVFAAAAVMTAGASSQVDFASGVFTDVSLERQGNALEIAVNMDFSSMKMPSNRAVLLRPVLANGADSLLLQPVALYGRRRYYYYLRNFEKVMLGGGDEITIHGKALTEPLDYRQSVTYQDWMDGASLSLREEEYGCCRVLEAENTVYFPAVYRKPFDVMAWVPEMAYVWPEAEGEKTDSLEGSANVEFVVDTWNVRENYRNNFRELGKISATIDSVRLDPDITITEIWLKGFASPESPYSHNTMLARNRVNEIKEYVLNKYPFDAAIIATDYEPEDWAGLRRFVAESNLPNRDAIIELIDTDMDPDKKEALIRKRFPKDYAFMKEHFYPALRHTNYKVAYNIRRFTDLDEIRRVLQENPSKLNLNEIYLLAQSMEPGSPEYEHLFDTAVSLFPNDPVANLNAANTALRDGHLDKAAMRLAKAGDSPEAIYARGVLAFKRGNKEAAKADFEAAAKAGVKQAAAALQLVMSH